MGLHSHQFRHGALPAILTAGDAQNLAVSAKVVQAMGTLPAFPTILGRIKGHPVAGFPSGNVRSQCDNLAAGFVAHNQRGQTASALPTPAVNITAADGAGSHANQNLSGARSRIGAANHLKTAGFLQNKCFHESFSSCRFLKL